MKFSLPVPGMGGHTIEVTTAALGRPPQLLIDGLPAPTGPHRGEWLVYRPDGTVATVLLTGHVLDIVPKVRVNGSETALTEPLQWHEWLLIGFPLILLFLGLPGAILGGAASVVNVFLVRSSAPAHVRSLSALGVAFAAFVIVLPLAVAEHRRAPEPPTAARSWFRPRRPAPPRSAATP